MYFPLFDADLNIRVREVKHLILGGVVRLVWLVDFTEFPIRIYSL